MQKGILAIMLALTILVAFPSSFADTAFQIVLNKTTYSYCEKLFYTIKVSEITGETAIIHIRDESGKSSSAIPIPISKFETQVPSLVPFEAEVFPLGKYYIDVEYDGVKHTAEFELVDSGNTCIPAWIKQLAYYWVTDQISDSTFSDGIGFMIENKFIIIPETESKTQVVETKIPEWVKKNAAWWVEEKITDNDFAQSLEYLIKTGIITISDQKKNEDI